ncbi:MAG: dihydrofolate reductase [Patescibacteria group bacterium]|nr:dihydrofolate reductase [Patescibacteria group bacterium]
MRNIITTTFVTLDGVMQAPGGPKEDTAGGFKHGGWTYHYWDKAMGDIMAGFMGLPFELLLGRKTYDIFAAYWPTAKTDSEVAVPFNATKKYVVSHKDMKLDWQNSELVTGDVVGRIRELKKMSGPDLLVHGSGNLIQTLLENGLIDRMHIWTFPVTVGAGKRLFAEGSRPASWKLVESKTSSTGVIIGTYEPAGELKTGTIGE